MKPKEKQENLDEEYQRNLQKQIHFMNLEIDNL